MELQYHLDDSFCIYYTNRKADVFAKTDIFKTNCLAG